MKLSPKARNYANALFQEKYRRIDLESHYQLQVIRTEAERSPTNLIQDIKRHLAEKNHQTIMARTDAYIDAYRKQGLVLDAEDLDEILNELMTMSRSHLNYVLSNMRIPEFRRPISNEILHFIPQQLMNLFDMALDSARNKLTVSLYEMMIEAEKNQAPNNFMQNNIINFYCDNFGPIQNGGSHNSQTMNRGEINNAIKS